jgi:hypothetical protein
VSIHRQAILNVLGENLDPNRPLTESEFQAILAEADRLKAAAANGPAPTADPRRAGPIQVSDLQLQLAVLRDAGMDEADAYRAIATGQGRPNAEAMTKKKTELQARADIEAAAAYDRSPAGREEAAQQALAQREADARLAHGARELIRDRFGDAVDSMSDADALINAGIRKSPGQERQEALDERARRLHPDVPDATELISTGTIDLFKEGN